VHRGFRAYKASRVFKGILDSRAFKACKVTLEWLVLLARPF
jgi:hypothetical protein